MGGGRPAGGRQCRIKDCPSCATIGLNFSLDHRGDPAGRGRRRDHMTQHRRARDGHQSSGKRSKHGFSTRSVCRIGPPHALQPNIPIYLRGSDLWWRWKCLTTQNNESERVKRETWEMRKLRCDWPRADVLDWRMTMLLETAVPSSLWAVHWYTPS